MSDDSNLFENLNFLVVVTKAEQLEATRSTVNLLKTNSCQICSVYKSFDTKNSTVSQDIKYWFINEVTEGNTIHFIISYDVNFTFYNVASTDLLIPVVTPDWIHCCIESQKLVRTSSFSPDPRHIFKDFQIYVSRHSFNHSEYLFYTEVVHALGGTCVDFLSNKTTHLVTKDTNDPGILAVINFGKVESMKFVYPTWIVQCFKQISIAPEGPHNISPNDSDHLSKGKLEDLWGRLNETDFILNSKIWENHSFIIGMDISLNRHLYSTLIEFLQANGGSVHRHLDESDIMKTKSDCYIGRSTSSSEYEVAENRKLNLGNLIWIFYMWSIGKFKPPTEKLIFSPFKRKLLETNQLISTYTNFFGRQRFYIQRLVDALGGFTTSELSRKNTHLLCRFPFGKKYETARTWGGKCVITNHLWLEECYKYSTKLDPLEPRFQQLPVEGGLLKTLGQMQWDNSHFGELHVKNPLKNFSEEEKDIESASLPAHNNQNKNKNGDDREDGNKKKDDSETENLNQQIPELQPTAPEPMEERIDLNKHFQSERINIVKEKSDKKSENLDFISQAADVLVDREPKVQNVHDEENANKVPSKKETVLSFDHESENTRRMTDNQTDNGIDSDMEKNKILELEEQHRLESSANDRKTSGYKGDHNSSQKPLNETMDVSQQTEEKVENTQERLQDNLEEIKHPEKETMAKRQNETTENHEHQTKNEINIETEGQEHGRKEESIKQPEESKEHNSSRTTHEVTVQDHEQNQHEDQHFSEGSKEGRDEQQSPKTLQEKSSAKGYSTNFSNNPISPRSAGEDTSETVKTANTVVPTKNFREKPEITAIEQNRDESKTSMKYIGGFSKSQTPPSSILSTSSDQMHLSQGSRRAAKAKAARKLHDDIESLNEFQKNSKRKKTGSLLSEEIAQLEKMKSLEMEARKILSKVLPEEHDSVTYDTESEIGQQQQEQYICPKRLPYSIDAISTGLTDDLGELDLSILKLIGINIHKDITEKNFSSLNGVIAPKKLRTAKFLKSLSFHPLKYAFTPKFLKDTLKIIHKGRRANITLDTSQYCIPDMDHDKITRLTSLTSKVFERAGILKINITIDIPGGVDTISSILKAHGVKDTKAIPTAHMNKLTINDFLLNDTNKENTTNTLSDYIFLVNKPTQVRFFKKLTKDSKNSALAVSWDWFVTSIFQLEVDVNNSEHVIYRSD